MKIRDRLEAMLAFFVVGAVLVMVLPFLFLALLFKLFMTPFDYIKYKRSRYQQDYPRRYSWLSKPHMDNEPYTAIKESHLPVEYIKWREEYDLNGYFVYQDILLNFDAPLFFDSKKGLWLWWPGEKAEEENSENNDNEEDVDNTDDCLTVEDLKDFLLDEFRNNISGRACKQVLFFYNRRKVEKNYESGGLDVMRTLDDFVVYEKGELATAIKEVIEKEQFSSSSEQQKA